jgi:hypothetical protein
MSGFQLHPDAITDIEEIWEFIAADNLDAADRILQEIYEAISDSYFFSASGTCPTRPNLKATAISNCPGTANRLRARSRATPRRRGTARSPQSAHHCFSTAREKVNGENKIHSLAALDRWLSSG